MNVLIIGDAHGDKDYIRLAIKKAIATDCEQIIQLGDFGYFPHTYEGQLFLDAIKAPEIPIYWLDGNHDNHERLDHDAKEPIEVEEGLFYLPRGYRWNVGVWNLMALGGAESIDRHCRTLGYDYWPNEGLTYSEIERAIAPGEIDILFCHDCPTKAGQRAMRKRPLAIGKGTRDGLQAVMDECKPRKIFHGHHHRRYTAKIDRTQVMGLDCNERPHLAWEVITL